MKTTKFYTMTQLDQKLQEQCKLDTGINEVFVNQNELADYLDLAQRYPAGQMQKIFLPTYKGEIVSISFEKSRAIANLLAEAEVDTLEELAIA